MKILFYVSILLLLFACNNETVTEKTKEESQKLYEPNPELEEERVPVSEPEVITFDESFLPEGYELDSRNDAPEIFRGNLNGNEKEDIVLIAAHKNNNDGNYDKANIMIFEDNGENEFNLISKSGNIIDIFNQMYEGPIVTNKNVFSIKYQAMRWGRTLKFRYEPKYEDFMLIGSEYESFGNAANDGSGSVSTNYLTGIQLENMNEFDYETEELKELPEKKNMVSKNLIPLSKIDGDSFYNY